MPVKDGKLDALWYTRSLQEPFRSSLLAEASDQKTVLQFLKRNSHMMKLESHNSVKKRAQDFCNHLNSNDMGPNSQIAVVAHKNFFTFLNAKSFKIQEISNDEVSKFYEPDAK